MSANAPDLSKPSRLRLSIDAWAVITAFLLTAVVRAGLVKHIPW